MSQAFFDQMLGDCPLRTLPVCRVAVCDDVHAQFVAAGNRFYSADDGLRHRAYLITHSPFAEFEAARPGAVEVA